MDAKLSCLGQNRLNKLRLGKKQLYQARRLALVGRVRDGYVDLEELLAPQAQC